jgi:Domain of unknown function (DUF4150)
MSITINVNNLSLCHKGSGGSTTATLPDVCKSPSIPIPYPNIAFSSDLIDGTTTIVADGGNMCANFGSQFYKSIGDEPGVGGGVVSSTFMKEATWITFSFDVKMEGRATCRLTDKMFQNHQNTVDLAGELQPPLGPQDPCDDLVKEVWRFINLIQGRWNDLKADVGKLPLTKPAVPDPRYGTRSIEGEQNAYKQAQDGLKNRLKKWPYDKCGPPPAPAWDWAKKPIPVPDPPPASHFSWGKFFAIGAIVVVGVAVAVVTVGAAAPEEAALAGLLLAGA